MKYFLLIAVLFMFGCVDQEAKRMSETMKPLSASEQVAEISKCAELGGSWTGMPVTYKNVTFQIRCVEK